MSADCWRIMTMTRYNKAQFAYEYLLRLSQGSRTGIVGGLTDRLCMPGRRRDAGDRGMGGTTVCGAQTGRYGVEPARLSAERQLPPLVIVRPPRDPHSPTPRTPWCPAAPRPAAGRTRGQVRRLPRPATCPLYWVPVRGYCACTRCCGGSPSLTSSVRLSRCSRQRQSQCLRQRTASAKTSALRFP